MAAIPALTAPTRQHVRRDVFCAAVFVDVLQFIFVISLIN